jgi:DNA-binding FrmR family transcriptional regulator
VGRASDLQALGIPIVHDLPEVGYQLSDHPDFILGYHIPDPNGLLGLSPAGLFGMWKQWGRYKAERRGMFTSNFAEINGFMRLTPQSPRPEVQYEFVVGLAVDHARKLEPRHGLSCHILSLRPRSRGSVKLKSNRWDDAPLIDPNFLDHPEDVREMVEGAKRVDRIIKTSSQLGPRIKSDLFTANCKTDADWEAIATRLETIDGPLGGLRRSLDRGREKGMTAAKRQVRAVVEQARAHASASSGLRAAVASYRSRNAYARPSEKRRRRSTRSPGGSRATTSRTRPTVIRTAESATSARRTASSASRASTRSRRTRGASARSNRSSRACARSSSASRPARRSPSSCAPSRTLRISASTIWIVSSS